MGRRTQPRCRPNDPIKWGADAIFNLKDDKLSLASYYKMPAAQGDTENCVAHNGSLIPIPGRDVEVQAWYQGGISVMDFTDPAHPFEIAYFDRGPINPKTLILGGDWSAYWYNGHIYGSEIARGLDIFKLIPTENLTQNEIDAAKLVQFNELNVQNQPKITWPAKLTVARAYVDQLSARRRFRRIRSPRSTRHWKARRNPSSLRRTPTSCRRWPPQFSPTHHPPKIRPMQSACPSWRKSCRARQPDHPGLPSKAPV